MPIRSLASSYENTHNTYKSKVDIQNKWFQKNNNNKTKKDRVESYLAFSHTENYAVTYR